MSDLRISRNLALPIGVAADSLAIIARKGRGKTYAASVLAEEMLDRNIPIAVLDPQGDWWGLRSSANGKKDGYSVAIMGGDYGDIGLEPTAGKLVADFVLNERVSTILDLSHFETRADEIRFGTAFLERLFRGKKKETGVLHLFVDEASTFAPQDVRGDTAKLEGAARNVARRGRKRGLGSSWIDQRAASVNKNVLSQMGGVVILGLTGTQDRKAMADWVEAKAEGDKETFDKMLAELPRLSMGGGYAWWPEFDVFKRVQIRPRRTFDSSATPEPGVEIEPPNRWSDVDQKSLARSMTETIERQKRDDPDELRKEITRLERELKQRPTEQQRVEVPVEVPVPLLEPADVERLTTVLTSIEKVGDRIADEASVMMGAAASFRGHLEKVRSNAADAVTRVTRSRPARAKPREAPAPVQRAESRESRESSEVTSPERRVLTALAQFPEGCNISKLSLLSGYAISGGFRNILATLRTKGLMIGENKSTMEITDDGIAALGEWEPLPTGAALVDWWESRLEGMKGAGKPAARVFRAFADNPDGYTMEEIADVTGYQVSGGFRNILSKLRTLNLIEGRNNETMRVGEDLLG